jgi:hypothetical protein
MTYDKQKGEKDFADKPTQQKHWNMHNLTKQDAHKKDFTPIQRWSEEHKSYATDSEQRLFEKIVSQGTGAEIREKEREAKLESFRN